MGSAGAGGFLCQEEMNRTHWLSWLGGTTALLVLSASVEGEEKPSLKALRIEEPLVVDGVLDEKAWGRAEKGSGFRQYDPGREIPATERTEFAILYDDDRLYLGVWCWDSQPGGVMARSMVRVTAINSAAPAPLSETSAITIPSAPSSRANTS